MKYLSIFALLIFTTFSSFAQDESIKPLEKISTKGDFITYFAVGKSTQKPKVGDRVTFRLKVVLNDSIVKAPMSEKINMPSEEEAPKNSLFEALYMMSPGDSVVILQNLDLLASLPPGISATDKLIFTIQMSEIKTTDELENELHELEVLADNISLLLEQEIEEFKAGTIEDLIELPSGLKIQIIEKGTGALAKTGQKVQAHYYGVFLKDATSFDDSFRRGDPFTFNIGKGMVIKGWDEGMMQLPEGSDAILYIPSEMAYGKKGAGSIGPNEELVFYVQLLKVN